MNGVKVSIDPFQESDLEEVMSIERVAFKSYWPASAFLDELQKNRLAHYFTARIDQRLVGYAGLWIVMDEAHITTIAVHPGHRRKKIGEQLLLHILTYAVSQGTRWATLEVRASNVAAQELYAKFGFTSVGVRKNYYLEENENAVIMWAGNLRGESFKGKLSSLRREMEEAISQNR